MQNFPFKIRSLIELQELLEKDMPPEFADQFKINPAKTLLDIIEKKEENDLKKYHFQSFSQLNEALQQEPLLMKLFRDNPVEFVRKTAKDSPSDSYKILKVMVTSLCILLILIVASVLTAWFTKNSREAPTLITAVACTTLGLLAGTFVKLPEKKLLNTSER